MALPFDCMQRFREMISFPFGATGICASVQMFFKLFAAAEPSANVCVAHGIHTLSLCDGRRNDESDPSSYLLRWDCSSWNTMQWSKCLYCY